jgi:hypothetical protein
MWTLRENQPPFKTAPLLPEIIAAFSAPPRQPLSMTRQLICNGESSESFEHPGPWIASSTRRSPSNLLAAGFCSHK